MTQSFMGRPSVTFSTQGRHNFHVPLTTVPHLLNVTLVAVQTFTITDDTFMTFSLDATRDHMGTANMPWAFYRGHIHQLNPRLLCAHD